MSGNLLPQLGTGLGRSLSAGRLRRRPVQRCGVSCYKSPKNTNGSPRRSRTVQSGSFLQIGELGFHDYPSMAVHLAFDLVLKHALGLG
jgi:hypothetical protein